MKLYLDTSSPDTILKIDGHEYVEPLARDTAEKIFEFIRTKLEQNGYNWQDISEITFMSGPGSFTGLRIGAAVVNTLADQLQIPLFDHHGKIAPSVCLISELNVLNVAQTRMEPAICLP